MESYDIYSHAIVALAASAILGLLLAPLSAMKKTAAGVASGGTPAQDYGNPAYRWHRAYLNLSEIMGLFVSVTVAAILAGASPFWVNLLATLFFLSRLAMAFVHVKGFGKENQGIRSFVYVFGWAMCLLLALFAIVAAF